jgi:hypothetical protein
MANLSEWPLIFRRNHTSLNQRVPGSSPGAPTTQSAVLAFCRDCRERPATGGLFRLRSNWSRSPFAEMRQSRTLVSGPEIPVPGAVPTRERRRTALTWGRGSHILAIGRARATNEKDDRDTLEPDGARALELSGRAAQRYVAGDVIISLNLKRRQATLRNIWRIIGTPSRRGQVERQQRSSIT